MNLKFAHGITFQLTRVIVCSAIAALLVFWIVSASDRSIAEQVKLAADQGLNSEYLPSGNDDHDELRMVIQRMGVADPSLSSNHTYPCGARVIGVLVDGVAIAYMKEAMADSGPHVVNSVIEGKPISVTYCSLVDCARVFTNDGSKPIELGLGGQDENLQMVLWYDKYRYRQESKSIQLLDYPFEEMNFCEWKEKHPDTLVFDGSLSPSA